MLALGAIAAAACVPGAEDSDLALTAAALTADQCTFFEADGKVQICHHTGSSKKPYTVLRTSLEGCVDGHADHALDYVAYGDPTCQQLGCYPVGAPADSLVPCCEGLGIDADGLCADLCVGRSLTPGPCQLPGSCDPATGVVTFEPSADGGVCDDGLVTTILDTCSAGVCSGSSCQDASCLGSGARAVADVGTDAYLEGVSFTVPGDVPQLTITSLAIVPPTRAASGAAIEAVSPVYEFGPATAFAAPLEIALAVGDSADLTVFWSTDGVAWEELDAVAGDGTLTIHADHFSRGVVGKKPCAGRSTGETCGDAPAGACAAAPVCAQNKTCVAAFEPATTMCAAGDHCAPPTYCSGSAAECPVTDGSGAPETPVACDQAFSGDSGTFTDARDGRVYRWVKIGRQYWMAENLDVGVQIGANTRQTDNCVIEKHCPQNIAARCDLLGGLYEYGEQMQYVETPQTRGICPAGWYLPSEQDWQTLITYVGGDNNAAWLKSTRTTLSGALNVPAMLRNPLFPAANLYLDAVAGSGFPMWQWPNTGARDAVGFNMLPADWTNATYPDFPNGYPATPAADGSVYSAGFWSSTNAIFWQFSSPLPYPSKYTNLAGHRAFGNSVRCVSVCSDSATPSGPFIGGTGTFTDPRDQRVYRWVRIDEEIYMRDNLVFGQPDGTYTWAEAMAGATEEGAQGACPVGWHVPTAEDWNRTVAYIGPTWWGAGTNARDRLRGATESANFNANNNHWLSTAAADGTKAKIAAVLLSGFAEAQDKPRTDAYAVRCARDSVPGVDAPMP